MGRAPAAACRNKEEEEEAGLQCARKGAWTGEEDQKLLSFIQRNKGHGSWRTLPKLAGLQRCGKSCRLRWTNYLRPNIKRGNFSAEEERIIIKLHAFMGNKWSSIASHLPGRTDNEVKNHWNTHLKKRLTKMGIDPTTHLPLQFIMPHHPDAANYYSFLSNQYQSSYCNIHDWKTAMLQSFLQLDPNIASHLAQWKIAKLEAEARMQIAASSHDQLQNFYASLLRSGVQQNQPPAYPLNDFMHAMNVQLQATLAASNSSLANRSEPLQPSQHWEARDDQFLQQFTLWEDEENQCLASSTLYNQNSSTTSAGIPHASEEPVYTSPCSVATSDTYSSESSSQQLLCDQALQQLPDLLLSTRNEMMPAALNPLDLSPPNSQLQYAAEEYDAANLLHDSYWNKMLNLLGPHSTTSSCLDI